VKGAKVAYADLVSFRRTRTKGCFRKNREAASLLCERANIGRDISSVHDCLADKPVKVT